MDRIRVSPPPPPPGAYDVVVRPGALAALPELLREAAPAHRYAVVADEVVAARYGRALEADLGRAGLTARLFTFPAGEANKTRGQWAILTDRLLEWGMGRDGCVVGLGGGVTGDLAGFVAATFMRGVPLVQVPTSLLAMVDASVGGKTGVDTPLGKNLVGAFLQPRIVVVDPAVLRSLPAAQLRAGLAEAVKHGAIADADYLASIEASADALVARDADALAALIRRSVEIKARFISADPREAGARKALNFGHTIGHAVEAAHEYRLLHGEAVAAGMVVEAVLGEAEGITRPGAADRLRGVLGRLGLPVAPPPPVEAAALVAHARRDKKARGGQVRYTLLARIGAVARGADGDWSIALDEDRVRSVLARFSA